MTTGTLSNGIYAALSALQIAAGFYTNYEANKQSKKLAQEQQKQILKVNNLTAAQNAISKTTTSISATQNADRAINSLKIPSRTLSDTSSSNGVGLYIPQ